MRNDTQSAEDTSAGTASSQVGFGSHGPPPAERGDYNGETVNNVQELHPVVGSGDRVDGGAAAEDTVTEIRVGSVVEASGLQPCEVGLDSCVSSFGPLSRQPAYGFAVGIMAAPLILTGSLQPSASATMCLAAFHIDSWMKD
ncbi:hypothetical protein CGC20_2510 [Leishmania donovani]|uniref:Uncharacterized protein n=1 Tax=Leishmania donovani TaxID=5661 RepID=A0A504XTA1_LEIDO|nr:hypothetical protein CGC20_2510 [Leishmania donovani]